MLICLGSFSAAALVGVLAERGALDAAHRAG